MHHRQKKIQVLIVHKYLNNAKVLKFSLHQGTSFFKKSIYLHKSHLYSIIRFLSINMYHSYEWISLSNKVGIFPLYL